MLLREKIFILASAFTIFLLPGMTGSQSPSNPLAFAFDSGNTTDIYIADSSDISNAKRLTISSRITLIPSFSPDGKQVLFSRFNAFGGWDIYKVPVNETETLSKEFKPFYSTPEDEFTSSQAWSPDGKKIVFVSETPYNGRLYARIFTMNVDGTDVKQLVGDNIYQYIYPEWSSKNIIAFVKSSDWDLPRIFTVNPDGSNLTEFPTGRGFYSIAWSPNGTKLAASKVTSTLRCLSIIDIQTGRVKDLTGPGTTNDCVWDSAPTWSPDGSKIIFVRALNSDNSNAYDLYEISTDGSGLKKISDKGYYYTPAWYTAPQTQGTVKIYSAPSSVEPEGLEILVKAPYLPGNKINVTLFAGQNDLPVPQSALAGCELGDFLKKDGSSYTTNGKKLLRLDVAKQELESTDTIEISQAQWARIYARSPCNVVISAIMPENVTITLKGSPDGSPKQNDIFSPAKLTQDQIESVCGSLGYFRKPDGNLYTNKLLYLNPATQKLVDTNEMQPFMVFDSKTYGYIGYRVAYGGTSDCSFTFEKKDAEYYRVKKL